MVKRPIPPRKPLREAPVVVASRGEPLHVYYLLWVAGDKPLSGFWYYRDMTKAEIEMEDVDGLGSIMVVHRTNRPGVPQVRVECARLDEAREYARQNGYTGLMVRPGGVTGDAEATLTKADVPPSAQMGVQEDRALTGRSARSRPGERVVDRWDSTERR